MKTQKVYVASRKKLILFMKFTRTIKLRQSDQVAVQFVEKLKYWQRSKKLVDYSREAN